VISSTADRYRRWQHFLCNVLITCLFNVHAVSASKRLLEKDIYPPECAQRQNVNGQPTIPQGTSRSEIEVNQRLTITNWIYCEISFSREDLFTIIFGRIYDNVCAFLRNGKYSSVVRFCSTSSSSSSTVLDSDFRYRPIV